MKKHEEELICQCCGKPIQVGTRNIRPNMLEPTTTGNYNIGLSAEDIKNAHLTGEYNVSLYPSACAACWRDLGRANEEE